MEFDSAHSAYQNQCEEELNRTILRLFQAGSNVSEAAKYSLLNGGKRVRGILVLAVADLLGGNKNAALAFSAAIEMIHAFSLVHDDLPSMDDDDMRRGKPANHIVYGEANALLAGDLLCIEAFGAIATADFNPALKAEGMAALAAGSGAKGMIYGQELDLYYETQTAGKQELLAIHRNKTGALILAAVKMGIISAGIKAETEKSLMNYANCIGLAFQIVDDILDVVADPELLGKPVGSDVQQNKTTFVTLNGIEAAKQEVHRLTKSAVDGLEHIYDDKSWFLCEYANKLAARIR